MFDARDARVRRHLRGKERAFTQFHCKEAGIQVRSIHSLPEYVTVTFSSSFNRAPRKSANASVGFGTGASVAFGASARRAPCGSLGSSIAAQRTIDVIGSSMAVSGPSPDELT